MLHIFSLRFSNYRLPLSASSDRCCPTVARLLLAAVCGAAFALPAYAARPMATDDADVADAGTCQLEAWNENASDQNTAWLNLACNPVDATEFAMGIARQHTDADSHASSLYGWQVKRLLRKHDAQRSGFAMAIGGQHDSASGNFDTFVKSIVTLPLSGEAMLAHVNVGAMQQREEQQRRYRGLWSMALDAEVSSATRVSIETFGVSGTESQWQLGVRHELISERLQLDASIGSAFGHWPGSRVLTLGVVFVSPSFMR